ncbi:hypothetical protein SDJN02_09709 [Cucurbita argyrosperma subsp. argyrosperma]|nr:hypothetical protein SDJN02_09709 [Cucurbita argyrosperma subsp. argyrosperma]
MANLPRFGRTWNRFSSLPRPGTAPRLDVPPPAATSEPEVYPSAPRTANVLQTSPIKERSPRITSPVRKYPSPPTSPKYRAAAPSTSPRKPLSPPPTYNRYDGERRSSALASPKTFKTTYTSPPRSPAKHKYSTSTVQAPLSPLALPSLEKRHEPEPMVRPRSPPEGSAFSLAHSSVSISDTNYNSPNPPQAYIVLLRGFHTLIKNVQQKSVLYQKTTSEKPAKTDHRASEYSSGKPQQKQTHQQQSDVINIKGENVGAVMHITQSSDATETHKKKPTVSYSSENEKDSNKSSSNMPGKSFMNSNFQGVNNSILYNSSLSHRDPGLHLAFTKKPTHADSVHDSRH